MQFNVLRDHRLQQQRRSIENGSLWTAKYGQKSWRTIINTHTHIVCYAMRLLGALAIKACCWECIEHFTLHTPLRHAGGKCDRRQEYGEEYAVGSLYNHVRHIGDCATPKWHTNTHSHSSPAQQCGVYVLAIRKFITSARGALLLRVHSQHLWIWVYGIIVFFSIRLLYTLGTA